MGKKLGDEMNEVMLKGIDGFIIDTINKEILYNQNKYVVLTGIAYLSELFIEKKNKLAITKHLNSSLFDETTLVYLLKLLDRIDEKIFERIVSKYQKSDLKAYIQRNHMNDPLEESSPDSISKLVCKLLDINANDIVIDFGSGNGNFLEYVYQTYKNHLNYGVELNTDAYIISNIVKLSTESKIQYIQGNVLSQNFETLNANKIFTFPPLGTRWSHISKYINKNQNLSDYFQETNKLISGEWGFAISALINQKEGGKSVVLMSNPGTWNKSDEQIRKNLLQEGKIEGVILLPENLLDKTSISVSLIVFSQNNLSVRMVDATKMFAKGRKSNILKDDNIEDIYSAYMNESKVSKLIDIKEIANQEYILNPIRYIDEDVSFESSVLLGDLCKSINRGSMITSSELNELSSNHATSFRYLMLQNIHDGKIDDNLPYIKTIDSNMEKYCLKKDSLIISKISPFKVAHFNGDDKKVLANGNLYFIEINDKKVNPYFLEMFLQSEMGMSQLNRYAKGTAMKSISIQDLKIIKIPNISRQKQDELALQYQDLTEEIDLINHQLEYIKNKKSKLIEEVI